jgi:ribosomal protein L32
MSVSFIRVKKCLSCGEITDHGMVCSGCGELFDEYNSE